MADASAADWVAAIGSILTPVAVAVFAYVLTRRQSRSEELVSARLRHFDVLMPDLNKLMCYLTFIGDWKVVTPPEVVTLKRTLDRNFHCAVPLFSEPVLAAYNTFMDHCFTTFGAWGTDASVRSSAYRRRPCLPGWEQAWDAHFAYSDNRAISAEELGATRDAYDHLVAAIVADVDITRARAAYTTSEVSLNAHAPKPVDVSGSGG